MSIETDPLRHIAYAIPSPAKDVVNNAADLIDALVEALEFYADPDSYFAIGFWSDPPCGPFIEDFEEFDDGRWKPGKLAREALGKIVNSQEPTI